MDDFVHLTAIRTCCSSLESPDRAGRPSPPQIDALNTTLEPLKSFVLPGGTPLAAHLHHCRTVSRRAERLAVLLAEQTAVNPACVTLSPPLKNPFPPADPARQ